MKHRTWITEALRLHFEEHLPQVVVGRRLGVPKSTACGMFVRFRKAGFCPQVCRSGSLMAVFTGVPPQYLSYFVVDR